jgi:serine-type D-Ala-D-Ala carboxypeptidase/endopeptidase (penicillin-binding protein 4)
MTVIVLRRKRQSPSNLASGGQNGPVVPLQTANQKPQHQREGLSRVLKNLLRLTLAAIIGVSVADAALLTKTFGETNDTVDDRTDVPTQTPLLSARRVPDLLAEVAGGSAIATRVTELFNNERMGGAKAASCVVVRQAGRTLVAQSPDKAVLPASTMKLITATAVLDKIKPTDVFTTRVMSTAPVVGNTLTGDLHLVGAGDPLLSTADYAAIAPIPQPVTSFEELADKVVALGITKITGDIVGDDRLFDSERAIPSWKESYKTSGEVGPLTALMVNDGFVRTTSAVRKRKAKGAPKGVWKATDDPAASASTTFGELLLARGVTIDGTTRSVRSDETPALTELANIDSVPVLAIIGEMLSQSDNTTAEMMVKQLSLTKDKSRASTSQGLAVVLDALKDRRIDTKDLTLVDGSGLDRGNHVTCMVLVQAIEAAPDSLRNLLPVAGESGTLVDRMQSELLKGKVRAKTGTLNGVSALVGDISTQGGGTVEFAMVLNELPPGVPGVATGDELATVVAAYPQYIPIPPVIPTSVAGSPPTTLSAATVALKRNLRPRSLDISVIEPPVGDNSLLPDDGGAPTTEVAAQ